VSETQLNAVIDVPRVSCTSILMQRHSSNCAQKLLFGREEESAVYIYMAFEGHIQPHLINQIVDIFDIDFDFLLTA